MNKRQQLENSVINFRERQKTLKGGDVVTESIADGSDDCALTDNQNQMDSDGDGYGNACEADLNNDGTTNYLDFFIFTEAMTEFQNGIAYDPDCDMDANGAINFIDYGMVTSNITRMAD